jgi:hypothetical protein
MTFSSDLFIPRHCDMQARIADLHASATRLQDTATAAQLARLSDALLRGARLRWDLGALMVSSPSGGTYRVTRGGCDCPNGQKCSKRACWHVAAFELLLDMLDTQAESADIAACDPPDEPNPLGDTEGDPEDPGEWRSVGQRQAIARSLVWASV